MESLNHNHFGEFFRLIQVPDPDQTPARTHTWLFSAQVRALSPSIFSVITSIIFPVPLLAQPCRDTGLELDSRPVKEWLVTP